MKRRYLWIISALYSAVSAASSTGAGTLSMVHFMDNGAVLVYTSASTSGATPSCAAGQPSRFAVDGTQPGGKVQLAGLLSAHASGKAVVIVGRGDCNVYGDSETIGYFYIVD